MSGRLAATLVIAGLWMFARLWMLTGPALADDRPPPPEGFTLAGDPDAGRAVFADNCSLCHGDSGDGDGLIFMDPPPRDLRKREGLTSVDDWDVYRVIRNGGQALGLSPKMLPWNGTLDDEQIRDVASFVLSLSAPNPSEPED